jgi:hypothetical protein
MDNILLLIIGIATFLIAFVPIALPPRNSYTKKWLKIAKGDLYISMVGFAIILLAIFRLIK